ncbi:MAG: hypothetical protein ABWZ88_05980 [Variovorax sp.]
MMSALAAQAAANDHANISANVTGCAGDECFAVCLLFVHGSDCETSRRRSQSLRRLARSMIEHPRSLFAQIRG